MLKFKHFVLLRRIMLWLNFFAVLFNATLFLYTTNYIIRMQQDYQLLAKLQHIPDSPQSIFWESSISFLILAVVMTLRHHINVKNPNLILLLEFILAIIVFISLRMTYNGVFLLVFVDFFISNRNQYNFHDYPIWLLIGLLLLLLFLMTDHSVLSHLIALPNLATYLSFLPAKVGSRLIFYKNFISALNLVLFILILVYFALSQLAREYKIQNKLALAAKTNTELKNYAALSGHIAQNRERKRIARDIHDTVGHALTGIAAGIDAALVLIDIDPKATKKQLKQIQVAVKQGLKDVRKALNQIRPGALDNYTLEASLKKMLKEYSDISHIKIDFNYHWGKVDFEKTTEDVIFRIIEESVTNSLRHGHATEVKISCTKSDKNYILLIQDNGMGTTHIKAGYGIIQMKERVAIIDGKISFNGNNGFSTKVAIPKEGSTND
ncbi:two-component sensor kinase [Lactobacillus acetotolerans]|uniref:histidine kinase n=2 Tax=Lactobacillus acetotolerans TaxID=1600 RepID=A0A0D6A590_9LACO|nr:sensor histidine kinase [Lactobacillus acetotolerans]BAQ57874.1 two-component sensor kinase [Lactobacillus acetotolerans]